jgi:hypothetical protein
MKFATQISPLLNLLYFVHEWLRVQKVAGHLKGYKELEAERN